MLWAITYQPNYYKIVSFSFWFLTSFELIIKYNKKKNIKKWRNMNIRIMRSVCKAIFVMPSSWNRRSWSFYRLDHEMWVILRSANWISSCYEVYILGTTALPIHLASVYKLTTALLKLSIQDGSWYWFL